MCCVCDRNWREWWQYLRKLWEETFDSLKGCVRRVSSLVFFTFKFLELIPLPHLLPHLSSYLQKRGFQTHYCPKTTLIKVVHDVFIPQISSSYSLFILLESMQHLNLPPFENFSFFFHGFSLLKLFFHFSECYLKEFHQYFSSSLLLEFHFQCLPFLIYFLFLVGLIHFHDLRKHVYVALCLHPRFLSLSPEWSTQLLIHLHLLSHGYLPLKIQRCSPLNSSSLWVYRKDLQ